MKSHQQMEDHEPSDLIPLFNGMIISFINYELQVRIEPKSPEELSQAKFDANYPADLFSATPSSAREQVATKVMKNFAEPVGAGMSNFSVPQSQREEIKSIPQSQRDAKLGSAKGSQVYSERFEGTVPTKPLTVDELVEQIWSQYDADGSGQLNKRETRNFVMDVLSKLSEDPKIPEDEFNYLFSSMDNDQSGYISKEEMKYFIRVSRGEEPLPPKPEKPALIDMVQERIVEAHEPEAAIEDEVEPAPPTPEEIRAQIWAKYDRDGNGTLSKAECRVFVKDLLSGLGEEVKISEDEFNDLFKQFDEDGNGVVSKDEMDIFIRMCKGEEPLPAKPEPEPVPPTPEEITASIWAEYDKDGSGALNKAECRKFVKDLLQRLGEEVKITEEEFNDLFKDFDEDGNGTVSRDEMALFLK
jgi:Ca2+-binding EF-hand superfamily protein